MVKFKVGSVYRVIVDDAVMPVKVTRIAASRKTMWFLSIHGEKKRSRINVRDSSGEVATYHKHRFYALTFHRLHPFFPSNSSLCKAFCQSLPAMMCVFHKEIMKTFLVFLFSVKLVVLARRAKQRKMRMYAVASEVFIAEEQNFDRIAKAVYENMLEV